MAEVADQDRLTKLEGKVDALSVRVDDRFDAQNALLDERFARINDRFDVLEKHYATKADVEAAVNGQTRWIVGTNVALILGALALLRFFPGAP